MAWAGVVIRFLPARLVNDWLGRQSGGQCSKLGPIADMRDSCVFSVVFILSRGVVNSAATPPEIAPDKAKTTGL